MYSLMAMLFYCLQFSPSTTALADLQDEESSNSRVLGEFIQLYICVPLS